MRRGSTHRKEVDQPRRQRQSPIRLEQLLQHRFAVPEERLRSIMPLKHDLEVLRGPTGDGSVEGGDEWGGEKPGDIVERLPRYRGDQFKRRRREISSVL